MVPLVAVVLFGESLLIAIVSGRLGSVKYLAASVNEVGSKYRGCCGKTQSRKYYQTSVALLRQSTTILLSVRLFPLECFTN